MAKTKYKVMLGAGLLLIAAALALAAYNVIDAQRAARSAAQALEALSQTTAPSLTRLTSPQWRQRSAP